ncbi:MAG: hypothetical protein ACUVRS_05005 [Armatimonadota bacterium]
MSQLQLFRRRVLSSTLLVTGILALCLCCQAGVRVELPEKFAPALLSRLAKASSEEHVVLWVKLKDRPVLHRAGLIEWREKHLGLPPVNEKYILDIAAVAGVRCRAVDELANKISVELPAGLAVGTLVRVWGRVVGGDGVSYFVINDGANLPVRVDVSGRRAAFEWAPAAGYVMLNGLFHSGRRTRSWFR